MKRTPLKAKNGFKRPKRSDVPNRSIKPRVGAYKRPSVVSMGRLKKQLDAVFSRYIRNKYAVNGMVACYTCSVIKPVKEMQCGHWIPRNILGSRFSEENCRPQCVGCNMFNKGRPDVFAVNLLREGIDIEKLQQLRYKVFKVDINWYQAKIAEYEKLLEETK